MRLAVFTLAFILLSSVAFAQSFSTDLEHVDSFIGQGEKAVFKLTVENDYAVDDDFNLRFTNDPRWSISTSPNIYYSSNYGMDVPAGESREAIIEMLPSRTVQSGVYALQLYVTSRYTDVTKIENILISVKPDKEPLREYLPAFTVDIEVPEKVDPREMMSIKVTLQNKNPLNITDMDVTLSSNLINKRFQTSLEPLESKTKFVTVEFDPLQIPTKDRVRARASVEQNNKTYEAKSKPQEYELTGYSFLEREDSLEEAFLKDAETITITNEGNVKNTADIKLPVTTFQTYFTKTEPQTDLVEEGGKTYYSWTFTLDPQESRSLLVTTNYRPLFIVVLILVIALVGYVLLRSPIVITKNAMRIGSKDNELTHVKVVLLVKNRGKKPIDHVKITDKIPKIAEVEKDFQVGTLTPSKIVKKKSGTHAIWEIPSIEPFEERIITYKIKASLSIVGGIYLPSAKVAYQNIRGSSSSIVSNKVEIQ